MAIENGRAERAPLLHRSTSVRAIHSKDDETEAGISTLRGTCIIASIGMLIFLQGVYFSCVMDELLCAKGRDDAELLSWSYFYALCTIC